MQGFPNWGMGEWEFPPTSQKFANSLHQKSTPSPPPKQQFSSYNPIKTAFLAVVNHPAPFLF